MKKGRAADEDDEQPVVVAKRVLSFDVGIRTLSSAVVGTTLNDELVAEHWAMEDMLDGRSKARNCLSIQADRLSQYMADFLAERWSTVYNARPLTAIIVEQQPMMRFNMKMRIMSYVLLACLRLLVMQSYGSNGGPVPPIYYQSAKAKLTIFAKSYTPPKVQTTLASMMISGKDDEDEEEDDDEEDDDAALWTDFTDIYVSDNDDDNNNGGDADDPVTVPPPKQPPHATHYGQPTPQAPLLSQQAQRQRYRANKKHSVQQTALILREERYCRKWISWYDKLGAKKDDAADAFLQAIYFLRFGRTKLTKSVIGDDDGDEDEQQKRGRKKNNNKKKNNATKAPQQQQRGGGGKKAAAATAPSRKRKRATIAPGNNKEQDDDNNGSTAATAPKKKKQKTTMQPPSKSSSSSSNSQPVTAAHEENMPTYDLTAL